MKRTRWTALLGALALVLAACGGGGEEATTTAGADTTAPADTTAAPDTTTPTETMVTDTAGGESSIGTADNPIQVLFVPSVSADEIVAGGEILAETLKTATGLGSRSGAVFVCRHRGGDLRQSRGEHRHDPRPGLHPRQRTVRHGGSPQGGALRLHRVLGAVHGRPRLGFPDARGSRRRLLGVPGSGFDLRLPVPLGSATEPGHRVG